MFEVVLFELRVMSSSYKLTYKKKQDQIVIVNNQEITKKKIYIYNALYIGS